MSGTRDIADKTINILSAGNMGGSLTSIPQDLQGTTSYSIQAVYTGSPNGTMKLQISMDGVKYSDYTGSTVVIAAAGDTLYKITRNGERFVQVVYTFSSGSGVFNALLGLQG